MRKLLFSALVLALFFLFNGSAIAFDVTYSSDGDFSPVYWKECFWGGGPGQLGNELTAVVKGASFGEASIAEPPVAVNGCYETIYEGGKFALGIDGPWLMDNGITEPGIGAGDITASNYSCSESDCDESGEPAASWELVFEGCFTKVPCACFEVWASYCGTPRPANCTMDTDTFPGMWDDYFYAEIRLKGPGPDLQSLVDLKDVIFPIFSRCKQGAKNHGQFVNCVGKAVRDLGLDHGGLIKACAANSPLP